MNGYDLNSLPEGFTKSDADKHARKSGRYYQKEVPNHIAIEGGVPGAIGALTKTEWFYDIQPISTIGKVTFTEGTGISRRRPK